MSVSPFSYYHSAMLEGSAPQLYSFSYVSAAELAACCEAFGMYEDSSSNLKLRGYSVPCSVKSPCRPCEHDHWVRSMTSSVRRRSCTSMIFSEILFGGTVRSTKYCTSTMLPFRIFTRVAERLGFLRYLRTRHYSNWDGCCGRCKFHPVMPHLLNFEITTEFKKRIIVDILQAARISAWRYKAQ